jgi:nucleotide-binding universal stress UspA family protein
MGMKILFAVDGSDYTVKVAQYIATHFRNFQGGLDLHLLHVRLPIPQGLALAQAERLLGHDTIDRYYKEEAEAALARAESILNRDNIPFQAVYPVGDVAHEIHQYSAQHKMNMIVMGSHGHGAVQNLVMGSVATKVIATTADIPILIVR